MAGPKSPRYPSRVLTTAYKMGIAITLALAKDRATGPANVLYYGQGSRIIGMTKIWRRAKKAYHSTVKNSAPDASVLLKVEHAIRRSFIRILLKTSVRYGNLETKRVKKNEGPKGYLNILWDYLGSRIRDTVKARYIFSKPYLIERSDGANIYGYEGTTKIPFYQVRHNHLPELDFGDMVRSPLMEIARQCLKYGVPIKDAKTYIDRLLIEYIPFMDYVYTERRSGRSNYVRAGLNKLRIIVDQIKVEYGTRNGERQSITIDVQENVPIEEGSDAVPSLTDPSLEHDDAVYTPIKETRDFIPSAIESAVEQGVIQDELLPVVTGFLESDIPSEEDSVELLRQAQEKSRQIGIQFHDYIAKNFQSPFTLNGILFHGTEMAYDDSGLMLFSEVSVDNGRGRIDLILVQAKKLSRVDEYPAPIYCEPILIADLKTKSAFDFDIYGVESKSTTSNNIVNDYILERRKLTDDEWKATLSNIPDESAKAQLDAYESAVIDAYRTLRGNDPDALDSITKAIIVVDSFQDWKDVSEALLPLIMHTYQGCIDACYSEGDLIIPSEGDTTPKIAMKLLSVARPHTEPTPLRPPVPFKPFKSRVHDKKDITLYLTVAGRGAPAQSAAAIAERWHGLEYLYGLARGRHRDVLWLDLLSEYTDPILKNKQFRLASHTPSVKRFFTDRIKMVDLSKQVQSCLCKGIPLRELREHIQTLLQDSRNPIIAVSGWENLRRILITSKSKYLDEIAANIIQALPRECSVLWFARPVPVAQNNITYGARCVAPFYQGSIWQNFIDTIIWNVALPPDRSGARYPTNDHERAIFIETPSKDVEKKIIEVPPLTDWGKDFRSGIPKGRIMYRRGLSQSGTQGYSTSNNQLETALELIPHLTSDNDYNPRPHSNDAVLFTRVSSTSFPKQKMHPLLSFRPTQIYATQDNRQRFSDENVSGMVVDGRVKLLLPMIQINRKREYREMNLHASPIKRTTKPPTEYYLTPQITDDGRIAFTQLNQLKDTIHFIRNQNVGYLIPLLNKLSDALSTNVDKETNLSMNVLRLVRQTLESHPLSEGLWKRLLSSRSLRLHELSKTHRKHLESLQKCHPDIEFITGNHLFLLLLASLNLVDSALYTDTLRFLWDYLRPWHLLGLGFGVKYPKRHSKRRSVFDRDKVFKHLKKRSIQVNRTLDQQVPLRHIRFGKVIVCSSSEIDYSLSLWLLFQRSPGLFDMNAALLNLRGIDTTPDPVEIIQELLSERTYWSETNLSHLSQYARLRGTEKQTPIMLAEQRGIQALFIADSKTNMWNPVGRIDYSTRKFEDVTLVRTITLTHDPFLQPVRLADIRQPIHQIEDMVEKALFILNKGLDECIHAKCKVSLDFNESMFRVRFFDKSTDTMIGELLVNRTVDLLEILRRPDTICEPVIINKKRLIWNRFKDIILHSDVALLLPWVNKRQPFSEMALELPPTAYELLEARKESNFVIEIYHDKWTCSLRHISLEAIQQGQHHAQTIGRHFMFRYISEWAEPEHISNEPGMHHGSCWRIHIRSQHPLPSEIEDLMKVRFTDAQLRALLHPQELVYWSAERAEWITHTFSITVSPECMREIQESWHLRMLMKKATGTRVKPSVPGAYLQNPDKWKPMISMQPERIVLEMRELDSGFVRERRIPERNVALREASEVKELLNTEMSTFLRSLGIEPNRRMTAAIESEIAAAIEIHGIEDDKAPVELESVEIGTDSVGGRVIYVVLLSIDDTYRIPVTRHLHSIKETGRVTRDEIAYGIESILEEFNLSEKSMVSAIEECVRLLRKEGLIKR